MTFNTLNLHCSSVIFILGWKCCITLKLQSKADAAISTVSLQKDSSTDHRVYVPSFTIFFFPHFVLLLLGFSFWPRQLTVFPDTYSQGTCLALIPADATPRNVKYLCCQAQAAVPALGFAGENPVHKAGRRQHQHVEQPLFYGFLLIPSLSSTKIQKTLLPATHSTRLSGSWSSSLLAASCPFNHQILWLIIVYFCKRAKMPLHVKKFKYIKTLHKNIY